jgi:hypothetical protein
MPSGRCSSSCQSSLSRRWTSNKRYRSEAALLSLLLLFPRHPNAALPRAVPYSRRSTEAAQCARSEQLQQHRVGAAQELLAEESAALSLPPLLSRPREELLRAWASRKLQGTANERKHRRSHLHCTLSLLVSFCIERPQSFSPFAFPRSLFALLLRFISPCGIKKFDRSFHRRNVNY